MKTTTLGIDQIKHRTQTTLPLLAAILLGWALASIKRTDFGGSREHNKPEGQAQMAAASERQKAKELLNQYVRWYLNARSRPSGV
jgi:hypothetical protein